MTDREKTIIDIAHRPELGGGIIQLAEALKTTHNDIDWEKVGEYIERWGGGSVVKRLGYLIETMSIPIPDREARAKNWRSLISKGISQLEPGSGKKGPNWLPAGIFKLIFHLKLCIFRSLGDD